MRVPLEAMRDVKFPLHGPGYLDFARLDPSARRRHALDRRLHPALRGNRELGDPQIVATRVSLPSDRSFLTYPEALASVTGAARR